MAHGCVILLCKGAGTPHVWYTCPMFTHPPPGPYLFKALLTISKVLLPRMGHMTHFPNKFCARLGEWLPKLYAFTTANVARHYEILRSALRH